MVGTGMLWFFDSAVLGSWFFGLLVFCSVGLGLRGFLGCTWDSWAFSFFFFLFFLFWDAGFLSFPLFCGTFGFFSSLFFSCSGVSGVLSHGAGFGLGFYDYVRIGTSDTL